MEHEDKYQWFDLFRGGAAVLVLIGHLRALTFLPYDYSQKTFFGTFFYFITGFGHQAVIVFFVLSGFFIVRSINESVIRGKWSVSEYILNRLTRLWVVLIPSLILTFLLDKMGMINFPNSQAYAGQIEFMKGVSPVNKSSLLIFFGNMFFLQNILVPTFGSNGALWSLANEFWYYTLFPLLYFAVCKVYFIYWRIALLLLGLGVSVFIGKEILLYFGVWLGGGILYIIVRKENSFSKSNWYIMMFTGLFVLVLTAIRSGLYPILFNDFSLALTTIFLLASLEGVPVPIRIMRVLTKFLANTSYTVYLTHLSFAVLLSTFVLAERMKWGFDSFLYFIFLSAVVLVYCWLTYIVFERNTEKVKEQLKHFIK